MFNFADNSLAVNLLIFAAGAAVIWYAGSKLERSVDTIASRYGLGKAFSGLVLLAGATSLPEIATTVTASINGSGALAVNNLMGGVPMQIAILAIADWRLAKGRLTFFTPDFNLLLQGVSLMLLLSVCIVGMAAGEFLSVFHLSGWTIGLMLLYLFLLYQIYLLGGRPRWHPEDVPHGSSNPEKGPAAVKKSGSGRKKKNGSKKGAKEDDRKRLSSKKALVMFGLFSLVVLGSGWTVAEVADTLTEQLQLSASFVGAVFVAITTSLPEVSTTTAAVRHGNYSMAISNIFGTNMLEVALLFIADIFYRQGPLLAAGGPGAIVAAGIGLVVTGIYLWGLLERRHRTVWRMGIDSALVLLAYLAGIAVLYKVGLQNLP